MKTVVISGLLLITAGLVTDLFAGERPKQGAPMVKKVDVGKNVYVETQGDTRRVVIDATVCLRQGVLEHLLCRKRTKEHEAILAADLDARSIHLALLLAGAEPGRPVKFRPKWTAPTGTTIKITLEYKEKGGMFVRVPAQQWIRHITTQKDLACDWVFAGSMLWRDPAAPLKDNHPYYLANDGDIICVSNFEAALLDLPIHSSPSDNEYEAHTERIPAEGTPVRVILEPVPAKK